MDHPNKGDYLLDNARNFSDIVERDQTKDEGEDNSEKIYLSEHLNNDEKSEENSGNDVVTSAEVRKSTRVRKVKSVGYADEEIMNKNVYKKKTRRNFHLTGSSFCCDRCKSPHIINPLKKSNKITKKKPTPRHKVDPSTKKILTLCNACGLAMRNLSRISKTKSTPLSLNTEDKEKYLDEGKSQALLLAKVLNNPNAAQLYCVKFKKQGCACLQTFIKANDDFEESKRRASHLLELMAEAKQLSQQKCYNKSDTGQTGDEETATTKTHKCRGSIGLGNGQKRSLQFEEFVLKNRVYLREQLNLCERATQSILCYSNNFLHKRLKTDPNRGPRIQRKKGKAALGLLLPIEELSSQHCCNAKCVSLAVSHSHLLNQWRERATSGQAEARRVLAEMLIPCGGARSNCYRFISMVTGCSHSTICNVSEQMRRTGGNREPPEHGLKQWWKAHPRSKPTVELNEETRENEAEFISDDAPSAEAITTASLDASTAALPDSDISLQLQIYKQQLIQLQRQVVQQKIQLQQQQQIIDQQLLNPQVLQWQQVLQQQTVQSKDSTLQDSINLKSLNTKVLDTSLCQQNKDQFSSAESILQKMLLDCPSDTSSIGKTVDFVTSDNGLITEYQPGLNITILQQSVSDSDTSSTDRVVSQMITTSGFENVVFIDPILVPNSNDSQSQSANSTTNLFNTSSNWDET